MRGRGVGLVLATAAALLCVGGGVASAKTPKPVLHLEAGGKALEAGAPVTASGTSFTLVSANGTVSCTEDALTGSMTTNLAKTDLLSIESGSFTGEEGGSCSSTDAPPLNEAIGVAELLPWNLTMTSKGAAAIKSTSPEFKGAVLLKIKPLNVEPPHGAVSCMYKSGKLKTKFATDGEPISLSFSGVKFSLAANSAEECKRTGSPSLTASFALTSGGEPVTATLAP